MAFFETEFPRKIGFFGSTGGLMGGPMWSTIVNKGFSGFEQRNRNWASPRRRYQLDLVSRPLAEYLAVLNFFMNVGGMADSFRFYDATDFQALAQPASPAVGDGVNKVFQLQKQYSVGGRTFVRTINKPVMSRISTTQGSSTSYAGAFITDFQGNPLPDTVVMYLNGASAPSLNNYTIDATTGLIMFASAPGAGVSVTSDCQFHTPARFDSDEWPSQVDASNVFNQTELISVSGIALLEVLILAGQAQG